MANHKKADPFDRLPPHSLECEMCTLAAMLLNGDIAKRIIARLSAEDFFLADHQIIFDIVRDLHAANRPVDAIILKDELKRVGKLNAIGGAGYIAQILALMPSYENGIEYARRVREHSLLRFLIRLSDDVSRRAYAGESAMALAHEAMAAITSRTPKREAVNGADHPGGRVERPASNVDRPARPLPAPGVRGGMGTRPAVAAQQDQRGPRSVAGSANMDRQAPREDRARVVA